MMTNNKNTKIRLIAVDIDGTLLNSSSKISDYTHDILQKLCDKYIVVPTTGRSFYRLREDTLHVNGIRYVISANGAVITDGKTDEKIYEFIIPRETVAQIADLMLVDDNLVYIHCDDKECTHIMSCLSKETYMNYYYRKNGVKTQNIITSNFGDFIRQSKNEVVKLGLKFTTDQAMINSEKILKERFKDIDVFRCDRKALEVSYADASKGKSLMKLCSKLNIQPEEVCAIGDNGNDLSMIQWAGLGVAMGNSIDELKEAADIVVGTNDNDGAAHFFEKYFNLNEKE